MLLTVRVCSVNANKYGTASEYSSKTIKKKVSMAARSEECEEYVSGCTVS